MPKARQGRTDFCLAPVPDWQLVGEDRGRCCFYRPFSQQIDGVVVGRAEAADIAARGGRCGHNQFDPTTLVCQLPPGAPAPPAPARRPPTRAPGRGSGTVRRRRRRCARPLLAAMLAAHGGDPVARAQPRGERSGPRAGPLRQRHGRDRGQSAGARGPLPGTAEPRRRRARARARGRPLRPGRDGAPSRLYFRGVHELHADYLAAPISPPGSRAGPGPARPGARTSRRPTATRPCSPRTSPPTRSRPGTAVNRTAPSSSACAPSALASGTAIASASRSTTTPAPCCSAISRPRPCDSWLSQGVDRLERHAAGRQPTGPRRCPPGDAGRRRRGALRAHHPAGCGGRGDRGAGTRPAEVWKGWIPVVPLLQALMAVTVAAPFARLTASASDASGAARSLFAVSAPPIAPPWRPCW